MNAMEGFDPGVACLFVAISKSKFESTGDREPDKGLSSILDEGWHSMSLRWPHMKGDLIRSAIDVELSQACI